MKLQILFEQEIQVMYRRAWEQQALVVQRISDTEKRVSRQKDVENCNYTGEWIVKELRRWHVLKAESLVKEFLALLGRQNDWSKTPKLWKFHPPKAQ